MNHRFLHYAVFGVGLAAVAWVGLGYVGSHPLALTITVLIGAFYLVGGFELHRFQQATGTLVRAVADLAEAPPSLGTWLDRLHPSLRNAVRLRIEGERVGLPGPALTPYLAGLLVLLGMLGTFLGMVVTLNGTGLALENASDLQAMRASLAAPVKGLGVAFGTSLAGVAASAMLGLLSALSRRDRLLSAQRLDTCIATTLRVFSLAHRRDESFRLLQLQTEAMPALVDRLDALMATIERQGEALNERLVAGQDRFHDRAEAVYTGLATSVGRSLTESLTESARSAGATIQPVVEATMAGIARETAALQASVAQGVQRQLEGVSSRFEASATAVAEIWRGALAAQQRQAAAAHEKLQADMAERDAARLAAWAASMDAMAARGEASAGTTIAEVARLVQAASEAPRAAAEVIAELRQKLSDSMARDNAMLDERSRILGTLDTLLGAVNHASTEQRSAIDALVAASTAMLDRVGIGFAEKVDAQTGRLDDAAAQVAGGAAQVASLGEAFGQAVQQFSASNDRLGAQLQRIEGALGKSMTRSDEQLAYYVAQAREVIDLSMLSQRQIVEDLQQLAGRQRTLAGSEA